MMECLKQTLDVLHSELNMLERGVEISRKFKDTNIRLSAYLPGHRENPIVTNNLKRKLTLEQPVVGEENKK